MRRLTVTIGLVALLGAALAGCARKSPGDRPAAAGQASVSSGATGNGGLGDGPGGPSASPPAPATTAPPPPRTLANKAGYVWADQPTSPSYVAGTAYLFNSAGGQIAVTRLGTGSYRVRFAGLADAGGVAHATAYGSTANFCAVVRWFASAPDQNVDVACYDPTGAPADTRFVANFAVGAQSGVAFSYLWAEGGARTGRYTPANAYRFDTAGDAWVERVAVGRYRVYLPASRDTGGEPFTFQVSAYGGGPALCKVSAVGVSPGIHEVTCRNAAGAALDSRFALTFSSQGSLVGRGDRRYGEYTQASAGVAHPATGSYTVTAAEMGAAKGQVVVYASGGGTAYCHVGQWNPSGADLRIDVRCYAPGGAAADSPFQLGVTW